MIYQNLYEHVLLNPVQQGMDKLMIVSGYASAAMATRHLQALPANVKVCLIVGMYPTDGIKETDHLSFQKLMQAMPERFTCRYLTQSPPAHTKTYVWSTCGTPSIAYTGSANYSHNGFFGANREAIAIDSPKDCAAYYDNLKPHTTLCNEPSLDRIIKFKVASRTTVVHFVQPPIVEARLLASALPVAQNARVLTFLDRNGALPQRSGLNWGQRPEHHRDPNQAYIPVPLEVRRSDFFPERPKHFTTLTDDGFIFDSVRAQDDSKAIHSSESNALLGAYFRNRLGLPSGALVTLQDLHNYGRTDVTFYKIDEENFLMDFATR